MNLEGFIDDVLVSLSSSQSFSQSFTTFIRNSILKVIVSDPNGNANLPLASGGMMVCEWFVTS